jgi:hypothetical protein
MTLILIGLGLALTIGTIAGFTLAAVLVAARDQRPNETTTARQPKPDWGRRGTQPKGKAGPKPPPNGRLVATKPHHEWTDAW